LFVQQENYTETKYAGHLLNRPPLITHRRNPLTSLHSQLTHDSNVLPNHRIWILKVGQFLDGKN